MSKRPSPSKHQSKLSPKRVRLEEDPKIIELQQKMKSRIPDIPVVQSENDHRQYRIFTLFNGLKVCLISDPEIDQAAVALTVKFGMFNFIMIAGIDMRYRFFRYLTYKNLNKLKNNFDLKFK